MDFIKSLFKNLIGPNLYYFSLILLVIGLPLSPFLTSMAQMWLGLNWVFEGKFNKKWSIVKRDKILWLFLLLPFIYLFGLWNTSDLSYALHDLKIKVPLFLLPVIIRTAKPLNTRQIKTILWFFSLALLASSLISMAVYLGFTSIQVNNIRGISIFISHIRFALMIVFSLCFLLWNTILNYSKLKLGEKLFSIALIVWFFVFISILQSMTSWVVIVMLLVTSFIVYVNRISNIKLRIIVIGLFVLVPILITLFVGKVYKDYTKVYIVDFSSLPTHTPRGNKYVNDSTKQIMDGGHHVYSLLCKKELRQGWPSISDVPFLSKSKSGYTIEQHAMRYLTSLGLPKDLDGLKQLDETDIALIEHGYSSSIHKRKFKPYIRMYETIYELDVYKRNGNANNKSISMRIEFFKTGLYIIKNNFWTGVGTGDVKLSYEKAYKEFNSVLTKKNRHRGHNQYLTFFITFGIFGFIICLFSVFGSFYLTPNKSFLVVSIALILFTSMTNEDILETQAGVTFYILFYCLLITHNKKLAT